MAEMTKKYLRRIYWKDKFEIANKIISTVTAVWIIGFMERSKEHLTFLDSTNKILYDKIHSKAVKKLLFQKCSPRLLFLKRFK